MFIASAIECYDCTWTSAIPDVNKNCKDSDELTTETPKCSTSNACGKYVIKVNDGVEIHTVVSRGCMAKSDCPKKSESIKAIETCVTCDEDLCNGGNLLNISLLIIILSVILIAIK